MASTFGTGAPRPSPVISPCSAVRLRAGWTLGHRSSGPDEGGGTHDDEENVLAGSAGALRGRGDGGRRVRPRRPRRRGHSGQGRHRDVRPAARHEGQLHLPDGVDPVLQRGQLRDRKSTRLNSSHLVISYAVFCLKKKKKYNTQHTQTKKKKKKQKQK